MDAGDIRALMQVEISEDRMSAWLSISDHPVPENPPEQDASAWPPPPSITPEELSQSATTILEEHGIRIGIDATALQRLISQWIGDGKAVRMLVASGTHPHRGTDGSFALLFQKPPPPQNTARGTVDLRKSDLITNISAGTALVRVVPPTAGIDGIGVTGETIAATPGTPASISIKGIVTPCTELSGDIVYKAAEDGILARYSATEIFVSRAIRVTSDVDYSTGHIEVWGNVEITGSVTPHFSVTARGNVTIGGLVQSATIEAGGNITVTGGVIGKEAATKLIAGGDITCRFLEHATAMAGGSVTVQDAIVDSTVQSGGNVTASNGRGTILASSIVAAGSVVARTIGSAMEFPVTISVGHQPAIWGAVRRLKRETANVRHAILKSILQHARHPQSPFQRRIQTRRKDQRKIVQMMERSLNLRVRGAITQFSDAGAIPSVTVQQQCFPNTKIRIGPYLRHLADTQASGRFLLDPEREKIIIVR